MSDKKVNISFACDKWNSMSKIDEQNRYCSSCDKVIHDFSKSKQAISKDIYCGHFDLSQVNSIKNSFSFSRTGVYTISLMAMLGVSYSQNQIVAQNVDSTKEMTDENEDGKITIKGFVRDNDKKYLEDVTVLLELKDSLLQRTKTNEKGYFEFEIDTKKQNVSKLDIKFLHGAYIGETISYSDLKSNKRRKKIEVILESSFCGNYRSGIMISGMVSGDFNDEHEEAMKKLQIKK